MAPTLSPQPHPLPRWRSLLFVPAHVERFIARAHERGADGIILDLEDAVPAAEKPAARAPRGAPSAGPGSWWRWPSSPWHWYPNFRPTT